MIDGILVGIATAFTPSNLIMVAMGCVVGTAIGMLPGLGPITAIALMIPLTYGLDPSTGMILMAGVYYGAIFGGSTSSILLNAPGVAGTVASAFDGYPLARSGHAGKALAIAAYSSFSGGTIGALLLLLAAPMLANVALGFQSPDYFALMVLGLTAVAGFAGEGQLLKALMMAIVGLMLSTVGTDASEGIERFTFGRLDLIDGISFLLLAMATFALSEALMTTMQTSEVGQNENTKSRAAVGSLRVTRSEVAEIAPAVGRSSVLGFIIGVLPGAGATIASFLAYGMERLIAPHELRRKFGKGALRGLAAPESANNAACTGSFVPLLTLGIPGSGTTAVMLGALLSYNVQPGPQMMTNNPEIFWAVIVSMYIGNLVLLFLNLPLIPYIARILLVPKPILTPLILYFSLIGVYLVSFNTFDLLLMTAIAVIVIVLRIANYPLAPLILGFILGGMLEENLRRSLELYDNSYAFLLQRPLTLSILILAGVVVLIPVLGRYIGSKVGRTVVSGNIDTEL